MVLVLAIPHGMGSLLVNVITLAGAQPQVGLSPVAEHQCCRASAVKAHGLSSCGAWA